MNAEIKHRALRYISYVLTQGKIPHVYNVKEETITLRNVDMTDVLLELHCYQDEYIADLHDKIFKLESLVNIHQDIYVKGDKEKDTSN